jgi:hypothetical protein
VAAAPLVPALPLGGVPVGAAPGGERPGVPERPAAGPPSFASGPPSSAAGGFGGAPLPGGAAPGGAAPLALPDLEGAARAAMASVLERDAPAGSGRRAPDVIELAHQARLETVAGAPTEPDPRQVTGAIGFQTPHVAPLTPVRAGGPVGQGLPLRQGLAPARGLPPGRGLTPAQASAPGQALAPRQGLPPAPPPPAAGVWRPPPPPVWRHPPRQAPPAQPLDRSSRPDAALVPGERDAAQRVGDALYPFVAWLREGRSGWFGVAALFGITGPIVLLRQNFDVRLRLVLSFFVAIFWIQLLSGLFGS